MTTPDYREHYMINEQAAKYNVSINENLHHVNNTLNRLEANETKYGAPYCPCLNNHNEDTICPCKYMREKQACRCGLYMRKQEGSK